MNTRITLMSDLHMEFCPLTVPVNANNILFLAGDITNADCLSLERTDHTAEVVRERTTQFLKENCAQFKHVYWIAGNHEHYHGVYEHDINLMREFVVGTNITVLDDEVVEISPGLRLFGGTFWTDYQKENSVAMWHAEKAMSDHRLIYHENGAKFTPDDALVAHKTSLRKLRSALDTYPNDDFIVMSHHCPTYKSIHPKYGNDILNYAFSSDLSDIILDTPRIKVWCHGHTHDTFKYTVGDCRVFCNPRGYTNNPNIIPENESWDPTFTFEV